MNVARSRAARSALNPIQLIDHVRFVADEVRSGNYPYVRFEESSRWHQRIYRDPRVDVWLISWLPSQGTQLHDHGGSAGAFTVLSGELSEAVFRSASGRSVPGAGAGDRRRQQAGAGTLVERRRQAGDSAGFGPRYVHDVRNLSDAPAVSVHAYSPPLESMNYYDLSSAGTLIRVASQQTDDPEATPPRVVPQASATRRGAAL